MAAPALGRHPSDPSAVAAVLGRIDLAYADPDLVVLEGLHAVKHALVFGGAPRDLVTDDPAALDAMLDEVRGLDPSVVAFVRDTAVVAEPGAMRSVARRGPASALLAVAERRAALPAALLVPNDRVLIALDEPRHAGNAGAVVRVAAAADAAGVLMVGSLDAWSAPVVRAAAGLHWALPVGGTPDRGWLCDTERRGGRCLVALDPHGDSFDPRAVPRDAVLAFGSERHGLGADVRDAADRCLALPMRTGVSSLNLATSVAAVLYALRFADPAHS